MRLARLAAVGLAIGVIAGFAIALLRPRPQTPSSPATADEKLRDRFRSAQSPVVELRTPRRVTG